MVRWIQIEEGTRVEAGVSGYLILYLLEGFLLGGNGEEIVQQ